MKILIGIGKESLQHNIIFKTRAIIHPRLDVITITDVQYTPKNVCNGIKARKSMQRYPIFLTDEDYDYILDEIEL